MEASPPISARRKTGSSRMYARRSMPSPPPARIEVTGLTMGWDGNVLLQDASFTVAYGEVFAILGGSGCGKSTLLRHLIGLEQPMSGRIFIDGVGAPALPVERPRYGVMFQSGALFGSMSVLDNVALGLVEWTDLPREVALALAQAKLALVGLSGAEKLFPSQISGGMKKRAAIARSLVLEPSLLFLDEPSAGLDPVSAVELDDLILALSEGLGMTVVVVTHELASIFKIASRCIMLDKKSKSIIARGDPRELRDGSTDPRVKSFFNRTAEGG